MKLLITLFLLLFSTHEEENKVANPPEYINKSIVADNPRVQKVSAPLVVETVSRDIYDTFEITAYSNHFQSTGKRPGDEGYGITRSGVKTREGITIAADWNVLPKGSVVWIEGLGKRVVQDTGSAIKGNKIDVYFEKESDAEDYGRKKNVKVKVMKGDAN